MKLRTFIATMTLAAGLASQASSVSAVQAPPNPGDFAVNIMPGAPAEGTMPDCDPDLTTIGQQFMSGATSVTATCVMSTKTSGQSLTGTATNSTLAATTGDTGFAQGTIEAKCDAKDTINMKLSITMAVSSMDSFSGTIFQACSFIMTFADASQSSLTGTIEVNGTLGSADGTVANNVIKVVINAKVFVTTGTGAFAGYSGTGDFSQTQEINVDPNNQGGRSDTTVTQPQVVTDFCTTKGISPCTAQSIGTWCMANQGPAAADCTSIMSQVKTAAVRAAAVRAAAVQASTMKLALVKSAGKARILAPAPAPGKPKAAAKVTSRTKVVVAAPKGARCTVQTNTRRTVGTGTVTNKYGQIAISPKSGVYKGSSTITATCRTKAGKTLTSNKVRITLS